MLAAGKLRAEDLSGRVRHRTRRGAVIVMAAISMILMMAVLALCIDLGYYMTLSAELKRATDAAALAGAGTLIEGSEEARLRAFEFLVRNPTGKNVVAEGDGWQGDLETLMAENADDFSVEVGHWDPDTRTFTASEALPSTIRVTATHRNAPLLFGKLFHNTAYVIVEDEHGSHEVPEDPINITAESIARYQPRDIALVLDFSASMNDDSELKRIGEYGEEVREAVEANLLTIYGDLGSPSYGNLQFEPEFLTVVGAPPSGPEMPQLVVTFQSDDVYVASTKDLSNVVLGFSDGTTQKFEGLSGTTGTFRGTGGNYNKRIDRLWVKSGSNDSGEGPGYGERFEDDYATIKQAFGLDGVAYPYASGSWDNYISYVKTSSSIRSAGYRKKYGHLTWMNYLLEQKPVHSQTADLWMVRAQPVASVKDAVGVFMEYIQEVDCEDRVALAIYNSVSQEALLEHSLTEDFPAIEDIVEHRQAGHYDQYTNIGAGIREGRLELQDSARAGSFKMIVLMTDGIANRPSDSSTARTYALGQAQLAADMRYPIVTISLGNAADTDLMQQIADMTGGVHFNVPGGGTVTDYRDNLMQVFRQIADDRPLVLVK
ncbi:MAG: hypothetical protein A2V70_03240 [Planctomycetes bacterium RBG_13_63_9]|nr:MAG: hypothetical protein A2V70_03240 [Planctomycetes bacterium RBG_13_63_9]